MRFRFIEDRRADYPVALMCDVLGVSPAGYYAWRSRPESRRSAANRALVDDIKRVHRDSSGRYGSPRIHVELTAQGRGASRGRIERLMRRHGIRAIMARPRRVRTTDSRHDLPIAPNLLDRSFSATAPNQVWLADITYIETDQGWLLLRGRRRLRLAKVGRNSDNRGGSCVDSIRLQRDWTICWKFRWRELPIQSVCARR
jgi:putative transposase